MHILAVNFHYIREEKPGKGIYPLSLDELSNQIDVLSKSYDFISQEDVKKLIQNNAQASGKNKCLLTFDDGLKEQLIAFEFLRKKGIPSVYYISTDPLENRTVVDVHKIHYVRSVVDDSELLNMVQQHVQVASDLLNPDVLASQYRYDSEEARQLKYILNFILTAEERRAIVDEVFIDLVGNEATFSDGLYFSKEEITYIDSYGCVGSHSASHQPLGQLSESVAKHDVEKSIHYIEEITGRRPISVSYPYGGSTAVPKFSEDYFSSLGLSFGLTMQRGVNHIDSDISLFSLKRVDTNDAPGGKNYNPNYFV